MAKRTVVIAAAVGAALLTMGGPALAASLNLDVVLHFQDDRSAPPPPVARYGAEGASFVFDRQQSPPLMRFDDNSETLVLDPAPAPRGDTVYRDDMGRSVLRATRLGGLTLFTPERPDGAPAALLGGADDLRTPPPMSPTSLFQHLAQDSARATRAVQHLVAFEAIGVTPGAEPLYADAGAVAAEAVIRMARRVDGRGLLARLLKVRLLPGAKPDAQLRQGVMMVVLAPDQGIAGRPSSFRIMAAAQRGR